MIPPTHRGGPEDIASDRKIWGGVKRMLWFLPMLSGTDDNGILVTMAHRGEMIQLHQLVHYHQEWWKGEKEFISISPFFGLVNCQFLYIRRMERYAANKILFLKNTSWRLTVLWYNLKCEKEDAKLYSQYDPMQREKHLRNSIKWWDLWLNIFSFFMLLYFPNSTY